jgi:hypothetical protein
MREHFFSTATDLAVGFARALPGLFTVALIFLIARFFVRLINALFDGVERQRYSLPWVYPETAQPTRRLVNGLIWLFALIAEACGRRPSRQPSEAVSGEIIPDGAPGSGDYPIMRRAGHHRRRSPRAWSKTRQGSSSRTSRRSSRSGCWKRTSS